MAANSDKAVAGSSVGNVAGTDGSMGAVVFVSATASVGGSVDDAAVVAFGRCEVGGLAQATSRRAKPTTTVRTLL